MRLPFWEERLMRTIKIIGLIALAIPVLATASALIELWAGV